MLWRIFRAGVRNLFRNAWLSIAAIAVMVVALTIMLSALVLNITARDVIAELSKNLKVSIYLQPDTTEEDRFALESSLRANEYVEEVEYVSKEEAHQRFVQSFRNDEQLIAGLALAGSGTLPASYEVSTSDLSKMPQIENVANEDRFKSTVESITLGKTDARTTIDRAATIQGFVTRASIFAASIFTVVSALIIFNTIRMALFTRSEEIRIMKLIGASRSYIRGPFLVEASMYGIIAGIIASSTVYSVIASVGTRVAGQEEFAGTYQFFTEPSMIALIFLGTVGAGVSVGLISSILAMKRYLKLKNW